MATTYDHIDQNKRRTWLLVLLFPISFILLVWVSVWAGLTVMDKYYSTSSRNATNSAYSVSSTQSVAKTVSQDNNILAVTNSLMLKIIPYVWGAAILWILVAYFRGDQLLLGGACAVEIFRHEQPEIFRLVENLCITKGLPLPRIYVINDSSLNAFATGRDPSHASIALTKGILLKLDRAELEGVIAHELAHVENRDIRLMLITVAGISFFTFLAEICFRMGASSSRGNSSNKGGSNGALLFFAIGVILTIYGYIIAPLIRLALSRTREFQADATAALTTRNPAALASALRKISEDSRVEVLDSHASMSAMCIESPMEKKGLFSILSGMLATHPPIKDRIAALMEMDGRVS